MYVLSTKDVWIIYVSHRNTEEQLRYRLHDHDHAYNQIIIDIREDGDTDLEAKEESHKTKWPVAAEEGEDGPNNPCVGGR